VAIEPPGEVATWLGGICALVAGFFLKHLHNRIEQSATKDELIAAINAITKRRTEDEAIGQEWRRERRDAERAIFDRLARQDVTLARIDERTGKLAP
jgi:hypothetical protein